MRKDQIGYNDFVCYLNDDDKKIAAYVNILSINSFLTFETKEGNIISIPPHRVLKIKQKGVKSG